MGWLGFLAVAATAGTQALPPPQRYGIMLDAGTVSSRVFIYTWVPTNTSYMCFPEQIGVMDIRPGLATYTLHPEDAGNSLKPLMDYAKEKLADVRALWKHIPVFLTATAGMRMLSPDEREDVLESTKGYLRGTPFKFKDFYAVVCTGEEEGVYAWLTVNYGMGNLRSDKHITFDNTIGSLYMGSASTQIVFIPEKSVMSQLFPMRLGRSKLRIYAKSFLHFGWIEAAYQVADLIISDALLRVQSVSSLQHPCFPSGYVYTPTFSYSYDRNFPINVSMQGAGNFNTCANLMKRIFNKESPCLVESCSFYGVYQPHLYSSQFIASGNFARVANMLALPHESRVYDMKVASEYVCSLTEHQMDLLYGHVREKQDRIHLCFLSVYTYVLLTYGYGFALNSPSVIFKENLTDEPAHYVTGAMIYHINQDPKLRGKITEDEPPQRQPPRMIYA